MSSTPSSSSNSRTYFDKSAFERPSFRAAAEKPSASTTCRNARILVSVSMFPLLGTMEKGRANTLYITNCREVPPDVADRCNALDILAESQLLAARGKKLVKLYFYIECPCGYHYIALAQSRTCLWVSAGPRNGEETGTVPGPNRSSRFNGQPMDRGHLEATTVRAFLVFYRSSKDRGY